MRAGGEGTVVTTSDHIKEEPPWRKLRISCPEERAAKALNSIIIIVFMLTMLLPTASCGQANNSGDKVLSIGIIQYAPHPSLDNCYTGFVEGLEEAGLWTGRISN